MVCIERVQAVFFDLDGTLTSYRVSARHAVLHVFDSMESMFTGIDRDTFQHVYWQVFDRLEKQQTGGKILPSLVDRAERFRLVLDELGIHTPETTIEKMAELYSNGRTTGVHVFSAAYETLDHLANRYILGVVTEGNSRHQRQLLENAGLAHFFRVIIISEEKNAHKPDPLIFRIACSDARVQPAHAVMVGDRIDWDMVHAKRTGMQTILFTEDGRYYNESEIDASVVDAVAHSYRDVAHLLSDT